LALNKVKTVLTKSDLPTVLAETTFSGNVEAKLTQQIDLQEIRAVLIEAVDGFEPKEEASDPLWEICYPNGAQSVPVKAKITPLFKE